MKHRLFHSVIKVWLCSMLLVSSQVTNGAQLLPLYQDVFPGEYWAINFRFKDVPFEQTGGADILLANGGSLSRGLLGSDVYLFHKNKPVAVFHNWMANAFALFKEPSSPYAVWGTLADLAPIFAGGNARIEFHPLFDDTVSDAFVNYQLSFFGATQSLGTSELSDVLVTPQISSDKTRVSRAPAEPFGATITQGVPSVPVPPAIALMVSGLVALALWAGGGRRDQNTA